MFSILKSKKRTEKEIEVEEAMRKHREAQEALDDALNELRGADLRGLVLKLLPERAPR